jgi:hypothetical protein
MHRRFSAAFDGQNITGEVAHVNAPDRGRESLSEMSLGLLTLGGLDTFAVQCRPRGDDDTDDVAELFPVSQETGRARRLSPGRSGEGSRVPGRRGPLQSLYART